MCFLNQGLHERILGYQSLRCIQIMVHSICTDLKGQHCIEVAWP